jgi:hypothetical protein
MKLLIGLFLFTAAIVIFISCEENFSPKTDFKEDYVLFRVINGATTFQTAILMKSYNVEGFDPFSNSESPLISDAVVTIYNGDKEIVLRDSSVETAFNWRYSSPFSFYYTDSLQPEEDTELRIEARLTDGRIISASTVTPKSKRVQFVFGSDRDIPTDDGTIDIDWQLIDANDLGQIYLPQLRIIYYTEVNGVETRFEKEVPTDYIFSEGKYTPDYPQPSSNSFLRFQMSAFDRALKEIAGDDDRSKYKIEKAVFELMILDNNLIPYYLTTETFLDGFTILVDE